MLRKLILSVIAISVFFSTAVFAVGLGEYKVSSGLNQPLKAEIALLSVGDLETHEIKASLASAAEFKKLGVERYFFLNSIKFKTVVTDDGGLVIKLSTRNPIKEPFLNFLVELNWPSGRFIREYTFLLDTPVFDDTTSSTIEKTRVAPVKSRIFPQKRTPVRKASSLPTSDSELLQPAFTGGTYGPVTSTDTLWSIAFKVKAGSQATIQQTLVAIFRANPSAFANGNIHQLLKGKVLQIPDAEVIANIPHRAALQDVVMQNKQWRSGGARRIVKNNDVVSRPSKTTTGVRLSLAAPENSGDVSERANGDFKQRLEQVQNELTRSQEESAILESENEQLRSRLADVLKKLESSQAEADSAISVADTELALLAKNQRDTEEGESAAASVDSDGLAAKVADDTGSGDDSITPHRDDLMITSGGEDNFIVEEPEMEASNPGNTQATSENPQQVEDEVVTNDEARSVNDTPASSESSKLAKKKTLLEEVMAYEMILWGGIAVVILLILGAIWRIRGRMEEDDFQENLITSSGAASLDTSQDFELPDIGDDMLAEPDIDETTEAEVEPERKNFDPLGEADSYIACGKYEHAETLLLEAIAKSPARSDIKVKLMECYSEMENKDKFEALAKEVSQAADADEWQQQIDSLRVQTWAGSEAEQMDDELDGDEFDLPSTEDIFGEEECEPEATDDSLELELDERDGEALDMDVDLSENIELDGVEDDFDFDIDDELGSGEHRKTQVTREDLAGVSDVSIGMSESDELSFDNNAFEADSALEGEVIGAVEAPEPDALDNVSLDEKELSEPLDLDYAIGEDDLTAQALAESDSASLDFDGEDFDFGDEAFDAETDSDNDDDLGDEMSTKLDLARAYIDMGDSAGAKEILSEVVAEGNQEQVGEAQGLMEKT